MSWDALLRGLCAASLSAAVLILAALPLRALLQDRAPRRAFCLLWDAALARLLILTALPSPLSVWRWLPAASAPVPAQSAAPVTEVASKGVAVVSEFSAASAPALDWRAILAAVWLTVGLTLAARFLWSHLRARRLYADSLPCADAFVGVWLASHRLRRRVQARTSDRIAAPLTCGVLRPIILLPAGMDWADQGALSGILEHEFQHIRRFDVPRKALLAAALCLHWFNPLAWLLYALSSRDMELACDEAVTARGADRAQYARTLLRMEERRGRWDLSGSHFSQNALEERIRAIMKQKRISTAAVIAVAAVMSVIAVVFAAAPGGETKAPAAQSAPETGYVYDHFQAVEGDVMILAQNGEDGEKQYSVDGGKTWLDEAAYRAQYGGSDWQVEWWTAEDYAAWLEEEKVALQSIIGDRGYTSDEGWFTWDQRRVDEAISLYESILENIKNGALYSKTITDASGGAVEEVMLGSDGLEATAVFASAEEDALAPEAVDESTLLEELRAFGVDGSADHLTYRGQTVRRLVDGAAVGGGYSTRYVYTDPDGAVDIHTLRAYVHHPDGSYDPMGALIGVAAKGDAGFDQGLIDSATFSGPQAATTEGADSALSPATQGPTVEATTEGSSGARGATFEEIFAPYRPYGLTYTPRAGALGALTYRGQSVKSFADQKPDGGTFTYEDPYAEGGLRVETEYDAEGNLSGLRVG